jgi:hypothetical protein
MMLVPEAESARHSRQTAHKDDNSDGKCDACGHDVPITPDPEPDTETETDTDTETDTEAETDTETDTDTDTENDT